MTATLKHISIGVKDPKHAVTVLAELTMGKVLPFSPVKGGYACLWPDWEGQFIEFYPKGTVVVPTDEGADFETGKEAAEFTKKLVEGKRIRLEFDIQQRDKYGRLLAYVFLEDGTFVNAEIVKEGYAQVMTIPPNVKYQDLLLKIQEKARDNQKGLWA